jgi:acylphosphatase
MTNLLVTYSGRVQGVGFRATARQIAQGFKVTGWVKNLPSGAVELLVNGEEAEVEAFLKGIRDSRLGALIDREVQESASRRPLKGDFHIES